MQLSLAAMNYLRTHYHAAIDIYKKILQDNRLIKAMLLTDVHFYSHMKFPSLQGDAGP